MSIKTKTLEQLSYLLVESGKLRYKYAAGFLLSQIVPNLCLLLSAGGTIMKRLSCKIHLFFTKKGVQKNETCEGVGSEGNYDLGNLMDRIDWFL